MDKLKGFYRNNRVFVILMGLASLCLVLVLSVVVLYFVNQKGGNAYGNRLNGIETVAMKDDRLRIIEGEISKSDLVERSSMKVIGKIIYINVYLKDGKTSDAQEIAIGTLDHFNEDEKAFYDLSFIFDKTGSDENSTFPIMGYKKSDHRIISWTNFGE